MLAGSPSQPSSDTLTTIFQNLVNNGLTVPRSVFDDAVSHSYTAVQPLQSAIASNGYNDLHTGTASALNAGATQMGGSSLPSLANVRLFGPKGRPGNARSQTNDPSYPEPDPNSPGPVGSGSSYCWYEDWALGYALVVAVAAPVVAVPLGIISIGVWGYGKVFRNCGG